MDLNSVCRGTKGVGLDFHVEQLPKIVRCCTSREIPNKNTDTNKTMSHNLMISFAVIHTKELHLSTCYGLPNNCALYTGWQVQVGRVSVQVQHLAHLEP